MNLAQMHDAANGNSGFARSDGELFSALNRAGFKVYSAVLKEYRGFFLKFDETSLSLSPANATQEYTLPADLTQIVHLAERLSASENWHPMAPLDMDDAISDLQDTVGWGASSSIYGSNSPFGFYGPYLDAAAARQGQALQIQKIRVAPIPDAVRMCQIAYTAKWLPITDASSMVMLPDEGTMAMVSFASAELCGMSDDTTRAGFFGQLGRDDLQAFLSWTRARQIMSPRTVTPYGPGY